MLKFFSLIFLVLSQEMIDEEVSKIEKCTFSWTITETKIEETWKCLDNVELYISWDNGGFNINIKKIPDWEPLCSSDWIWAIYGKYAFPKIWDKVDFLIWKWNNNNWFEYVLLSDKKVWEWTYKLISWTDLEWNFEICEPNYKLIIWNIWIETENIKYVKMGSLFLWIIVLLFIIIILFKKYLKNS